LEAVEQAEKLFKNLTEELGAGSVSELTDSFLLRSLYYTHCIPESISFYLIKGEKQGSYIVTMKVNQYSELCVYDREVESKI